MPTNGINFDDIDFGGLIGGMHTPTQPTTPSKVTINSTANPVIPSTTATIPFGKGGVDIGLLQSAQAKMGAISVEMNNLFVERDRLIRLMQLSIITGSNLLMLGPPGTAKSAITYELCNRITGANYFQWMLNKTSDPSEILGPFSVKEMENDKFLRITSGKLPEAHIAFMDEVFKSNAPTLNALLTIMNEHFFYNDGKPIDVPLISMFGASNEPPEDDSLNAMYDRFIFRMNVEYIRDAGNKKRMHSNYIDGRAGFLNLAGRSTINIQELQALQEATNTVKIPKDIINKFIRLVSDLERQSVHISDRRQNECFKIMQGNAVLSGRDIVGLDDFNSLIYVLWEKEEHIAIIESLISKMVNPFDDRFKELKDNFVQIKTSIDNTTDTAQKSRKAIESKGSIEKLVSKVNKLIADSSKNGKDPDDFITFRQEMIEYNQKLINAALGTSFNVMNNDMFEDENITI